MPPPPPDEPNTIRVYIVRIICIILLCHRVLMVFYPLIYFESFRVPANKGVVTAAAAVYSSIIARPYSFKHISRLYRGWPLSMYYEINRINNFNRKKSFCGRRVRDNAALTVYYITLDFVTNDIETSNNKNFETNDILWQLQ